ncbi:ATPase [Capsulimonas corticalis]|uniref:ATPase n=1 Tax=Capsulimonas corticalis TaxID=2219043 RepID=A0A402CR54_9BACT|nr:SRPBCC domain-containing protein [Capsulimonas corticalis]BDI34544.1 ATPase [Capsulimonas corticalis]
METIDNVTEKELVITRIFNAPRELVFKAWGEAERLAHWWGPKGFTLGVATLEFRPGGVFHYSMTSAQGQEMWGKFVYREIEAPERLVFVTSFSNPEGEITRAFFSDTWPLEVLNVVTFTEQDGKTTMTLRGGPINATEAEQAAFEGMFGSMQQGFAGTFDQLETYLASL